MTKQAKKIWGLSGAAIVILTIIVLLNYGLKISVVLETRSYCPKYHPLEYQITNFTISNQYNAMLKLHIWEKGVLGNKAHQPIKLLDGFMVSPFQTKKLCGTDGYIFETLGIPERERLKFGNVTVNAPVSFFEGLAFSKFVENHEVNVEVID